VTLGKLHRVFLTDGNLDIAHNGNARRWFAMSDVTKKFT
jgi:hypothetical protein